MAVQEPKSIPSKEAIPSTYNALDFLLTNFPSWVVRKLSFLKDHAPVLTKRQNDLLQSAFRIFLSEVHELHKHKFECTLVLIKCACKAKWGLVDHRDQVAELDSVGFKNCNLGKHL
jgi:hypothetical protein